MPFFKTPRVAQLRPTDLKQRLDQGKPLAVLDVREDFERAVCAIALPPTATGLHIPLAEVVGRLDEIKAAAEKTPLVIYCHHGMRSMTAATWLARHGVDRVANLEGGIDAWSVEVDPAVPRY